MKVKLLKIEFSEIQNVRGGNRCEYTVYGMIGLGAALSTSIVAAPLGIVVGGGGLFLAWAGACPSTLVQPGITPGGIIQKQF